MPLKTYVATKNLGKLDEMRAIFAGGELELDTFPLYVAAEENERTYAGNAQAKALALQAQLRDARVHGAVLADDSGIEVAALGGRPGIFSARFAGEDATWPIRREKLLDELADTRAENRGAKFCCAMALIVEGGQTLRGYGEVEGLLTNEEQGRFGFGYDPIFFYPPAGKTFAQLSEEEKNRVSHRRHAADAVIAAYRAWQRNR